jgi:hypothetical protein
MRYPPGTLQNILLSGAALLACVGLVACGDFCFSGVINNPNGVIITTKNASPPPACPPSPIISTMNVAAVKSQICETCTASSRAQHIFVTLKSIQLHSVFPDPPNTREWLELAPQFLLEPRQIDLLGDSIPVILVQNALVPAATTAEIACSWLTAASRSFISQGTATRLSFSCPCNTREAAHSLSCPARPSIYCSRCSRSRSLPSPRRKVGKSTMSLSALLQYRGSSAATSRSS